nr:hypothetical protein [Endozoicomonas sp.]
MTEQTVDPRIVAAARSIHGYIYGHTGAELAAASISELTDKKAVPYIVSFLRELRKQPGFSELLERWSRSTSACQVLAEQDAQKFLRDVSGIMEL